MSSQDQQQKQLPVCVIGAGPAGLAVAMQMERHNVRTVVLEQQDGVGGLWRSRNNNSNIHDKTYNPYIPIYKGLRTNLPAGLMSYYDHPFLPTAAVRGRPDANAVQRYLETVYDKEFGDKENNDNTATTESSSCFYCQFQFQTKVLSTKWVVKEKQWAVRVERRNQQQDQKEQQETLYFRALVVCTGHYDVPNIPSIQGAKSFPNPILHSKYFQDSRLYKDKKTILIVGGLSSAGDIANLLLLQENSIATATAASVHISMRTASSTVDKTPSFVTRAIHRKAQKGGAIYHPGIRQLHDNGSVEFQDGTVLPSVDLLLLATGYLYEFPFLPDAFRKQLLACRDLDPVDGWRVRGLYKRVWAPFFFLDDDDNNDNNKTDDNAATALSFVGLPNGLLSPVILFEFRPVGLLVYIREW